MIQLIEVLINCCLYKLCFSQMYTRKCQLFRIPRKTLVFNLSVNMLEKKCKYFLHDQVFMSLILIYEAEIDLHLHVTGQTLVRRPPQEVRQLENEEI